MLEDSFYLGKVSQCKITKRLAELKYSKATGLDNMPARFVKYTVEHMFPCITHIIDLSIEQVRVPYDLNLARVIPLHKKGSKAKP